MLKEVKSAVNFVRTILLRNGTIPYVKVELFSKCLEQLLCTKFEKHWHPDKPFRGSAFRCIRINQTYKDPEIQKAAAMSGVPNRDLLDCLPREFTIWIDPFEVSYRIGEDGSICELSANETEDSVVLDNSGSLSSVSHLHTCHSEVPRISLGNYNQCPSGYAECLS